MARVKYSGLIAGMRGKLSGGILSACLSANTLRTKTIPINRKTLLHSASRSSLAARSQEWRELTEAERDTWILEAPNYPRIDQFGDPYEMSGFNLYCFININRVLFGRATEVNAPAPEAITQFTALSLEALTAADALNFSFTPTPFTPNADFIIQATPQLLPGIGNASNKYRIIKTFQDGTVSPQEITNEYKAVYPGDFVPNRKIFVKAIPYHDSTYQSGVEWIASSIIT